MRLDAVRHLADVVRALARPERIVVMGSASLFAAFPGLDQADGPLANTYDADFLFFPWEESTGRMLNDAVGKDEEFHAANGYYADILRPLVAEDFTPGWEDRLVPMPGFADTVYCLDPYDMAVCKLRAGRPKDIHLLAWLLREGLLEAKAMKQRLDATPMGEAVIVRTYACFRTVQDEAKSSR